MSRQRLSQVDGEISLSGLDVPVDILCDRWGIPYIYAQSIPDVLFA
jgi:acyl-homoserine lactone acylase PvdQ